MNTKMCVLWSVALCSVVKIATEPLQPSELPKMVEGLRKINKVGDMPGWMPDAPGFSLSLALHRRRCMHAWLCWFLLSVCARSWWQAAPKKQAHCRERCCCCCVQPPALSASELPASCDAC